ncbi:MULTISPECIES: hypothetical protein [unclassified Akkermansia]|jgi:hypothetical protein|uniref:hypothetical protein n=2 Tax=unclassified Akkermansia TaxID=2608915 RepID=UPI001020A29B|nr:MULTISPECIES: hypothetical protein [unclassified Akkermansia]KAA3147763.1 hypothetical protein F2A16_07925 [Akkermansia sp. BIOML-A67]KAA3165030.1 hypothetical protein F2A23_07450 [Akkermansia sp. BIOML-A63]KAA3171622.1 hypothetical protein F2A07_09675 [Akkermansia sp. BIOML-A61]KAA3192412.1 hypothetical protein F2A21_10185 [Akkermansia sp. BIOML-A54]KAA3218160.1 hypothetical protein F1964_10715 [Akkermansia sp. BIOML-A38]KAA3221037.1 hypothetical protein F1985_10865 [Akkermansia sp. BIOML
MASPLLSGIFLHARKKSRMRPAGFIPVPFGKGGGKSRFLPHPAGEEGREPHPDIILWNAPAMDGLKKTMDVAVSPLRQSAYRGHGPQEPGQARRVPGEDRKPGLFPGSE